jgi:hypothetical protein
MRIEPDGKYNGEVVGVDDALDLGESVEDTVGILLCVDEREPVGVVLTI